MGVLVKIDKTRQVVTGAEVAAAGATCGADELVIWVGANVSPRYLEANNGIEKMAGVLKTFGNPTSTTGVTQIGSEVSDLQFGLLFIDGDWGVIEDSLDIAYGTDFQAFPGQSVDTAVKKVLNHYRDYYAKKAA